MYIYIYIYIIQNYKAVFLVAFLIFCFFFFCSHRSGKYSVFQFLNGCGISLSLDDSLIKEVNIEGLKDRVLPTPHEIYEYLLIENEDKKMKQPRIPGAAKTRKLKKRCRHRQGVNMTRTEGCPVLYFVTKKEKVKTGMFYLTPQL